MTQRPTHRPTSAVHTLVRDDDERASCGVGFIADLKQSKSHALVDDALTLLERLAHRGAVGADKETGDGAGILLQLPHRFFKREGLRLGLEMPRRRRYAVGQLFLPRDAAVRASIEAIVERVVVEEGQQVLGWREVPVDASRIGVHAKNTLPVVKQVYVVRQRLVPAAFDRVLYVIQKRVENEVRAAFPDDNTFHVASLSAETIVYKGLLRAEQLRGFYSDLGDDDMVSALAVVHSRFSTNTAPSWSRAQPMRMLAHNGEINTLRGNVNWMRARRSLLRSPRIGDLDALWPILVPGTSDSAHVDALLQLLVLGGRSLPHAMMMMIPEAFENDVAMADDRRAFYEYASSLVEPWDGPAAMCFTDGALVGATLDRNGLRPARWVQTADRVVLASEAGALPIDPATVLRKGRLRPGRMLLVDVDEGRVVEDDEAKAEVTQRYPWRRWITKNRINFETLPRQERPAPLSGDALTQQLRAAGAVDDDLGHVLIPMATAGNEPVGSMGNDTPIAALSQKAPSLFDYFHQLFAQVTNPPIDPLRESLVMSTSIAIGPDGNTFEETPEHCHQIPLPGPVLRSGELARLAAVDEGVFEARKLQTLYRKSSGAKGMETAVIALCDAAVAAVTDGVNILILSDRGVDDDHVALPALLATSAVHQRLVEEGIRMLTGLVVESAEVREVHHVACLIGFGAAAVNPWLALDTVKDLANRGQLTSKDGSVIDEKTAQHRYVDALHHGLQKVMSKMGVSTLQSYCGAQIFEVLGLDTEVVDRFFAGTAARLSGVSLATLHDEAVARHDRGFAPASSSSSSSSSMLPVGGLYQFRTDGEHHRWAPKTVHSLQKAARAPDAASAQSLFADYLQRADEEDAPSTLRGLLQWSPSSTPVPLDEVEPATSIVKRFVTGAMSFGSISPEAHEALGVAMNRLGARSNSGEGGEEITRPREAWSAIRQVASGRFGVTAKYLVDASDLQIKIAQGAKPGEGGQLPGHKVDARIAAVRRTTAGTTLISPPPHHDIYSIEDLSQLVYDLAVVNGDARISVKLVAATGIGAIAAGVAKAGASVVVIAGFEGGTGAAPLGSLRHAGVPWELGLVEAQRVLVEQGLRSRVRLQVDGGIRTPRDVVVAALFGAEEFGLATAALIADGCVMQRRCHLNTCSVGVATQDPALRAKFQGKPEHIVQMMLLVAEGVREHLAELGARSLDEIVGRVDLLQCKSDIGPSKARALNVTSLLVPPSSSVHATHLRCVQEQKKDTSTQRDAGFGVDVERGGVVEASIENVDRAVGSALGARVARVYGDAGLKDDHIVLRLRGSAGQSLAAFVPKGITIDLEGEANDGVAKGLCGGRVFVRPPSSMKAPHENVIIGNNALYGATSGALFASGIAGERFAVRNSGADAVVEGTGDHGCEYMTGGSVVVLGDVGRNFGAGMTGGAAFVVDGNVLARVHEDVAVSALSVDDRALVRRLLEEHVTHTSSPRARALLAADLAGFVAVRPRPTTTTTNPTTQKPPLRVVA